MKSHLITFTLLIAFTFSAAARAVSDIPPDPAVRHGVLPNGMHYYVRTNDQPGGMTELRLAVKAGSVHEDDDQKGLAHFTEHMLFNGTERFPENELIDVLESFGMEFGPEINAYTSFDHTVYQLSVNQESLVSGLDVLRDWAFHATLSEDQFEKERGVVLEEWRSRRGAQARMQEEIFPLLFYDSRYADRLPIGTVETIQNAPVQVLRRYYSDWYRPDLMAVIAVGDFDEDWMTAEIARRFGSYPQPPDSRPRTVFPIPEHEDTLVKIVHDPEALRSSVQLYVKSPAERSTVRSDVRGELVRQLYYLMLNQRLTETARSAGSPFLSAYGFSTPFTENMSLSVLAADVSEDAALEGLKALLEESERVRLYGFTESELSRAGEDIYSSFENYWKQQNNRNSDELVQPLQDAFLENETYPSADWQWDAVREFLPLITADEVSAVSQIFSDTRNRVVVISGPSVPGITDISEHDVRLVLEHPPEPEPWQDEDISGPLVSDLPDAGHVVSRAQIPEPGIQIWTLSNGATVILKPTDLKKEEILFQAYSPGGLSQAEDGDYISARYAAEAVYQGGLGDFSADDLRKQLAGVNVSLYPFMQDTYEGLNGTSSPEDLETMLELMYLYFTGVRRDTDAWDAFMNRTGESLKNRDASPLVQYGDLVGKTLYNDHFRSRPVTYERLSQASLDGALDFFKQRFSGASDFSFVLTGDFVPGEIEPLISRWIGGLPSGTSGEGWVDRGQRNAEGEHQVSLSAGAEPLSIVTQIWSGEWDGSFTQRYLIQSLGSALEMQFIRSVREESGGTYSVAVYPQINTAPRTDYRFIVRFSCAPERVEELGGLVRSIVNDWKSAPPDERFASDVTAAQLQNLSENMERNSWWLSQIVFAVSTGTSPEELMNRPGLYESLTAQLLSDTAARYLNSENFIQAVLYPEDY